MLIYFSGRFLESAANVVKFFLKKRRRKYFLNLAGDFSPLTSTKKILFTLVCGEKSIVNCNGFKFFFKKKGNWL